MYCNHCGKEIANDSQYCNYCGKEIIINTIKRQPTHDTKSDDSVGCLTITGVFVLLMIVLVIIPTCIVMCYSKTTITSSDYEIDTKEGLNTYTITITPTTDIKECNVELIVYNDLNEKIYENTITKENLSEGQNYKFQFNFSLETLVSGNKVKYNVTGTK